MVTVWRWFIVNRYIRSVGMTNKNNLFSTNGLSWCVIDVMVEIERTCEIL